MCIIPAAETPVVFVLGCVVKSRMFFKWLLECHHLIYKLKTLEIEKELVD